MNLAEIGPSWKACMKGTCFEEKVPWIEGKVLRCVKPIKPGSRRNSEYNSEFQPYKFLLTPTHGDQKKLPNGWPRVFSAKDVKEWISPNSEA